MIVGALLLQITASVTFLPLLNDRCSFDLLVYTDVQSAVPLEWYAPAAQALYCSCLCCTILTKPSQIVVDCRLQYALYMACWGVSEKC